MNQTTEEVIEFLNFPDLDFGTTPLDAEIVTDPTLLRAAVARLMAGPFPSPEVRDAAESLRGRLDGADWARVAQEFQERITLASGFFEGDAEEVA